MFLEFCYHDVVFFTCNLDLQHESQYRESMGERTVKKWLEPRNLYNCIFAFVSYAFKEERLENYTTAFLPVIWQHELSAGNVWAKEQLTMEL